MDPETVMLGRLDPHNKKILEEYQRHLRVRNISPTTIRTKLFKVYAFLKFIEYRPCCRATPPDAENFYLHRKETQAPATSFGDLQELRVFFKWLLPEKEIITFRPQRPRHDVPPEKVLTSDCALKILECCESQRDRAMVTLFWDSGARVNEILSCNIGHVQFDKFGAIISVNGKTGRRPIRLVSSVPDLQAWIRIHPLKDDPNAPLFVTSRKRGTREFTRLKDRTVENLFKRLGGYALAGKKTNPHSFRHGRATNRAQKLTEPEMRAYFGWSKASAMPSVYVHLSARDIDNKVLQIEGVKKEDAPEQDPMAVISCPRCGRPNAPDASFCGVCLLALTDEAAQDLNVAQGIMAEPDNLMAYAIWKKQKMRQGQ